MNEVQNTAKVNTSARDPIEWAIIAVIIAGSSLMLALETKITARQRVESEDAVQKARAGNRLRLSAMRDHLNEMRGFVFEIPCLGEIETNITDISIARNSIIFQSDREEEIFNQKFDRITMLIARINRCLSEIDAQGFQLNDNDLQEYVTGPMQYAKNMVIPLLQADIEPKIRIERVCELLGVYEGIVKNLENALLNK